MEEGEDDDEELDHLFTKPVIVEDPRGPDNSIPDYRKIEDPEELLQWLVAPIELSSFFESVLEQQPAFISRPKNREYYSGILSKKDIDGLLRRKQGLQYTYNVDVTHYSRKGVRENFNYNGKLPPKEQEGEESTPEIADADVVWRRVEKDGCSMRLLHPQRFSDPLWRLLSKLEDFWRSCMGSNSYLTPPGSQGFAPHFDDIDAFILQLEGSKTWKLYAPTSARNVLPRYSSRDFTEDELGEQVLEVVLQPGDLLYLPRGQVHQAQSLPDSHSLHLTISANQQRTWQGLFESLLPRALTLAASQHRHLRASVPRELSMAFGTVPNVEDDISEEDREQARETVKEYAHACLAGIMESIDFDWGADQWDTEFLVQRLPPPPVDDDSHGGGAGGSGARPPKLKPTSTVQVVHPGAARLMIDADGDEPMALVAHCNSNVREVHAAVNNEESEESGKKNTIPSVLEFPIGCAETLAELLGAENEGVQLDEVTPPEDDAGVSVVEVTEALIKAGLVKIVRKKG